MLRIAVLAHLRFPIGEPFCGGMEAHTFGLVRGLQEAGYDVKLYASGDSDSSLPLRPVCKQHFEATMPWLVWQDKPEFSKFQLTLYKKSMELIFADGNDLIHNNCLHPYPIQNSRSLGLPLLTSLHIPPFPELRTMVHGHSDPTTHWYTTTSTRQLTSWGLEQGNASAVHNGIDLRVWKSASSRRNTRQRKAIWCGRITPNKGLHLALSACSRVDVPLDIYGSIEDQSYYDQKIRPQLSGHRRYLGHATASMLASALGEAQVLLFTPLWDEPFGLVMAEALACGTPIAGIDNGAVTEVAGDCGVFVPESGGCEILANAIQRAMTIPSERCSQRAGVLFGISRMIADYGRCYDRLMDDRYSDSVADASANRLKKSSVEA